MLKLFAYFFARLFGRNADSTPVDTIIDQLNEPRPLPIGRKEFEEWSDRIIAGAMMKPGDLEDDATIFKKSQKYALAGMLMHLGPTESHKPDAYFIHCMRKYAINQTAHTLIQEINHERKAALAEKEGLKIVPPAEQGLAGAVPNIQ